MTPKLDQTNLLLLRTFKTVGYVEGGRAMEIEVQVAVGTESRPINNPEPFRFVSDIKSAQARPSRVTFSPGEEGTGEGGTG